MSGESPQALLSLVVDEFERRRWRDQGQAALKVVRTIQRKEVRLISTNLRASLAARSLS